MRRTPLLVAVWLAGVVVATGTGLLAVQRVADSVGDDRLPVLSADDVARALASASAGPTAVSPQTARPTAAATPTSPVASAPATFSSGGGTVGVRCEGTAPRLLYARPAPGYRVDDTEPSAVAVEVRFESSTRRVRLEVGCGTGRPVLLERRVDDRS